MLKGIIHFIPKSCYFFVSSSIFTIFLSGLNWLYIFSSGNHRKGQYLDWIVGRTS